jgi:transcriptional regulator GlxA family with amidase domain
MSDSQADSTNYAAERSAKGSSGSQPGGQRPPISVAFILLPEFTLLAFSSFVEVLRLSADRLDGSRQVHCHWTILGPSLAPIKSSCGAEIRPWEIFSENDEFDYIVVVGGLVKGHPLVDPAVLKYLQRAGRNGRNIVALCTGTFILAAARLLNGHRASVHWVHEAEFKSLYPNVALNRGTLFSVSPRRITCSGGAAGADLAAYVVSRHFGIGPARKAMVGLGLQALRSGKDPQAHKSSTWFSRIDDPLARRAILIMGGNIGRHYSVAQVCASLNVSSSSLERAFKRSTGCSPAKFGRMLRLAYGHWELMHSAKSITQIATDFGFTDSSHFIQFFHRYYGVTPMALRKCRRTVGEEMPVSISGEVRVSPVVRRVLMGELLFFEEDQRWLDQQISV